MPFSASHRSASRTVPDSRLGPRIWIAVRLARRMTPAASTAKAGQDALSSPKTASNFMQQRMTRELLAYRLKPVSQILFHGTLTKALGKSSRTENSLMRRGLALSATQTFAAGAYSASNWRHAPHGIGAPGA